MGASDIWDMEGEVSRYFNGSRPRMGCRRAKTLVKYRAGDWNCRTIRNGMKIEYGKKWKIKMHIFAL